MTRPQLDPAPGQTSGATSARLNPQLVADLTRMGVRGLLPVAPPGSVMSPNSHVQPGKVPSDRGPNGWRGVPDWPKQAYSAQQLQYQIAKYGAGLGLNTTKHPYLDVDVTDPELAVAVEGALADLLNFPLKRVGRAPKFAVPCTYAPGSEPFPKMRLHLRDAAGQDRGMIEVLSDRCFIVLAGNHPKTGQPYAWQKGEQVGGVELLAAALPESLPQISRELVVERLLPALQAKLAPLAVTATLSGSGSAQAAMIDPATLLMPGGPDEVRTIVEQIPNDDADYDRYLEMGLAIRGACGDEHNVEGLEIWQAWCARSVKNSPELNESKWPSLQHPRLGGEYLLSRAQECGVNIGPYCFDADPNATPTMEVPPYVATFNDRFALVRQMARVVLHLAEGGPEFIPLDHWRVLTAPEKIEGKATSQLWLTHPARRVFRQITMDPARPPYSAIPVRGDDPDFNIWPGLAVQPSSDGSCDLFLAHLRDVVCSGNEPLYQWVLQWLAAMVQAPERLTGTALVLRGPMGSGKSYVGEVIGRLLGAPLYSKVSKPDELTGRFNSHHQGKILLQVEEGFFAGNRAAVGALKHMITSDRVRIEGKFRDSYEIPNYCRLLITSNEEWVIPAGLSERRFTVIDISGDRKDDWEYHAAMRAQMQTGGHAKLLHVLLNTPLDFKLLSRPFNTTALRDQQLASMEADQRWLYDILQEGGFTDGRIGVNWLYDHYSQFLREHSAGRRVDRAAMGRLLGGIGVRQEKVRQGAGRSRVYVFPSLNQCRQSFAVGLATSPEWDSPSAWPGEEPLRPSALPGEEPLEALI